MSFSTSLYGVVAGSVLALSLTVSATSAGAGERSCKQERTLRSQNSNVPTKITFVNTSGMYRSINWIDFKGQTQSYGGLNPGETKTQQTFATHVWVIATGPGDCLQVFVAEPRPLTVRLPRVAVDGPAAKPKPKCPKGKYLNQNGVCQPNETGA